MNYEEKYRKLINTLQSLIDNGKKQGHIILRMEDIENAIPELSESEDEKVRKELMNVINLSYDCGIAITKENRDRYIAWLEKQGERKETTWNKEDEENSFERDIVEKALHKVGYEWSEDTHQLTKIKPKFHEGDWITREGFNTAKIISIEDDKYELELLDGNKSFSAIDYIDRIFHLWTIQDAKDGDILQLGRVTAIFKEFIGNGNCICYCSVFEGGIEIPSQDGYDNVYGCHNATPSAKEQRDALFTKMKENGCEWDAENKVLKMYVTLQCKNKVN